MHDRIQRQAPQELRRGVAETERRQAVRHLVDGEREEERREEKNETDRITHEPLPSLAAGRGPHQGPESILVGRSVTSHACVNHRAAASRTSSGFSSRRRASNRLG